MRVIFVIIGLLISFVTAAQFRSSLYVGYGSYNQGELKNLQDQFKNALDVDAKITASFPSWIYINGDVSYIISHKLTTGLSILWGSSGARISYNDYSGSITSDMLVSYTSIGFPIGLILNPDSKWQITIEVVPSYVFSKMDFNNRYVLGNDSETEEYIFTSKNIAVQPSIIMSRYFGRLSFNIRSGYNLTVRKGDLYLADGDGAYLLDYNNKKVRMDWNGLRLEAGLSWTFKSL